MSVSQNNPSLTSIVPFGTNFSSSSSSSSSSNSQSSTSLNSSPIGRVPSAVVGHIFSYLSVANLANMASVSLQAKALSELPSLWIPHCQVRGTQIKPDVSKNAKKILVRELILLQLEYEIKRSDNSHKISNLLRNFLLIGGNPEERVNQPIFEHVYKELCKAKNRIEVCNISDDSFWGSSTSTELSRKNLLACKKNLDECLDFILNYPGFNWCEASKGEDYGTIGGMDPSPSMEEVNHKILSATVINDQESLNRYLHFAFSGNVPLAKELVKKGADLSSTMPYKSLIIYPENLNFPQGSPLSLMSIVLNSVHSAQGNQFELAEFLVSDVVNKMANTIFKNLPEGSLIRPLTGIVAEYYGAKPLFSGKDIEFACENSCASFPFTHPGAFFVNRCLILALKHNPDLADFRTSSNKTLLEMAESLGNPELAEVIKTLNTPAS